MRGRALTEELKDKFIVALAETGNVTVAAQALGIGRRTIYDHTREDKEFAGRMDEAVQEAADRLEGEARRRAMEGIDEPVYQSGKLVGRVRKYSDTLLIFLLKGARPDKYRERFSGELHAGGELKIQFVSDDGE